MTRLLFAAAFTAALAFAAPASAAEPAAASAQAPRHSYEDVQKFVDEAVAHFKKVGSQTAFADFNDPKGKWIRNDLYIFAFDEKGVYQATGFRPERTGSNAWDMVDAAGIKVVQEIVKKAKRDGAGLVDYLWKNPATGKLENKTSYVVKAGDYILGAGFYHR